MICCKRFQSYGLYNFLIECPLVHGEMVEPAKLPNGPRARDMVGYPAKRTMWRTNPGRSSPKYRSTQRMRETVSRAVVKLGGSVNKKLKDRITHLGVILVGLIWWSAELAECCTCVFLVPTERGHKRVNNTQGHLMRADVLKEDVCHIHVESCIPGMTKVNR